MGRWHWTGKERWCKEEVEKDWHGTGMDDPRAPLQIVCWKSWRVPGAWMITVPQLPQFVRCFGKTNSFQLPQILSNLGSKMEPVAMYICVELWGPYKSFFLSTPGKPIDFSAIYSFGPPKLIPFIAGFQGPHLGRLGWPSKQPVGPSHATPRRKHGQLVLESKRSLWLPRRIRKTRTNLSCLVSLKSSDWQTFKQKDSGDMST